jgi:tRNA(fMet)-specific endonuclease VapC
LIPQLILDTNALSSAEDANPDILKILMEVQQLALPVVVIGEFRYGISRSRHAMEYGRSLDGLIDDCLVLDITDRTTHHYASIRLELRKTGKPIPVNDLWIAALCRQHDLPLLSRDRHFDVVPGIRRLEW